MRGGRDERRSGGQCDGVDGQQGIDIAPVRVGQEQRHEAQKAAEHEQQTENPRQ